MDIKKFFNDFFNRMSSRKLLVFIVASVFLYFGKLDNNSWVIIACVYVGSNALEKAIGLMGASKTTV